MLRDARKDEHPVEMLVGIMDVEMGTTDEEAAATDDVEVCAFVEADQERKKKERERESSQH